MSATISLKNLLSDNTMPSAPELVRAEANNVLDSLSPGTVVSLLFEDTRGTTYIRNIRLP